MKIYVSIALTIFLFLLGFDLQPCKGQDLGLAPINEEARGDFLIMVAESQEYISYARAVRNHLPTVRPLTTEGLREVTKSQIDFENGVLSKQDYDAIISAIPGAVDYVSTAKLVDKAYLALEKKFALKERITRDEFAYIVQYHADKYPLPLNYIDPEKHRRDQ